LILRRLWVSLELRSLRQTQSSDNKEWVRRYGLSKE
jgi:hypothetical protein